jgi:hypothetical protein
MFVDGRYQEVSALYVCCLCQQKFSYCIHAVNCWWVQPVVLGCDLAEQQEGGLGCCVSGFTGTPLLNCLCACSCYCTAGTSRAHALPQARVCMRAWIGCQTTLHRGLERSCLGSKRAGSAAAALQLAINGCCVCSTYHAARLGIVLLGSSCSNCTAGPSNEPLQQHTH